MRKNKLHILASRFLISVALGLSTLPAYADSAKSEALKIGITTFMSDRPLYSEVARCNRMVTLVAEERTLRGSYMGSSVPSRDIPRYLELFKQGCLPIDQLVTHRMNLDVINAGMDRLKEGKAIRQLITF